LAGSGSAGPLGWLPVFQVVEDQVEGVVDLIESVDQVSYKAIHSAIAHSAATSVYTKNVSISSISFDL
jgi:hypothetical protein